MIELTRILPCCPNHCLLSLLAPQSNNNVGSQTKAAACIGFICILIPGLLILCFPWDERDAYKVDGVVYDAEGKRIGSAEKTKCSYLAKRLWMLDTFGTKYHCVRFVMNYGH